MNSESIPGHSSPTHRADNDGDSPPAPTRAWPFAADKDKVTLMADEWIDSIEIAEGSQESDAETQLGEATPAPTTEGNIAHPTDATPLALQLESPEHEQAAEQEDEEKLSALASTDAPELAPPGLISMLMLDTPKP